MNGELSLCCCCRSGCSKGRSANVHGWWNKVWWSQEGVGEYGQEHHSLWTCRHWTGLCSGHVAVGFTGWLTDGVMFNVPPIHFTSEMTFSQFMGPTWQLETDDWSSKAILAQNRGGRPATYESWTGDCDAMRLGPIGLAETRGNSYVFSDMLMKRERVRESVHWFHRYCQPNLQQKKVTENAFKNMPRTCIGNKLVVIYW